MPRCQKCHAAIEFLNMTPAGNYMPVDVPPVFAALTRPAWVDPDVPAKFCGFDPRTTGKVSGWPLAPGEEMRAAKENLKRQRVLRPHWATCPAADEFRRPPEADRSAVKAPLATEHARPGPKPDPQGQLF